MTDNPHKLWTLDDVAVYLGVPKGTVYSWRTTGKGPVAHRIGKYLRYRPEDIEAWLNTQADHTPAA